MEEPHFIKCESVTESSPNLNTEESLTVNMEKIKVEADLAFTDLCTEEHSLGIVKEELDIQDVKEEFDDTAGPSTKQSPPEVSHSDLPPSLGAACFRCDLCGKFLASKSSIRQHLMRHTGNRSYKCEDCGMSFSHRTQLSRHLRIHIGQRRFECTICHESFLEICTLSTHMRTHTGEKSYRCTVCGKSFTKNSSLSRHNRIHTGLRCHECLVCNKTFAESGDVARHMRVHMSVPIPLYRLL